MATFDQIKKTILDVAGNPTSGVVADFADKWAAAIVSIDSPTSHKAEINGKEGNDGTQPERPAKETRVTKPAEIR